MCKPEILEDEQVSPIKFVCLKSLGTKFGLRGELMQLGIPKLLCRLCCLDLFVSAVVGARDGRRIPDCALLSIF